MFIMKIFLLAVLLVALFAAETSACLPNGATCTSDNVNCCEGWCQPMGTVGMCTK